MRLIFFGATPYLSQEEIYSSTGFYSKSKDQKRMEGATLSLARKVASQSFGFKPLGSTADFGLKRDARLSASLLNTMVLEHE